MKWAAVEHLWEINKSGVIRNKLTKKLLKIRLRKDGYLDVKLNYKRHLVHRLVAIAFIPNPKIKPQVNHKDGDRANPVATNLEWADQFENMTHAIDNGLFPNRQGVNNGRAKIDEVTAKAIKILLDKKVKVCHIARGLDVSYGVVNNIKRGLSWKNI